MRRLLIALSMLLPISAVHAQVSIEVGLPSVSIGFNLPVYPELVPIPGYPVYYAPRASSNYFFYDGLYWVYRDDNWYSSVWYNGPWDSIGPQYVPLFILRIPVRYYRQPPPYFRGWRADAPPRWGDHWGRDWEGQRHGWNRWNHRDVPRAAPLPVYQRKFTGDRYPGAVEQQHAIRSEHYRYQPREAIAREHFKRPDNRGEGRDEPRRQAPVLQQAAPEARPLRPNRQREEARPEPVQQPANERAPRTERRREAAPEQQFSPPESRRPPADQSRQRPPPEPAMQRQPDNERAGRQEQAPRQQEQGRERKDDRRNEKRDDKRDDERGPDRR